MPNGMPNRRRSNKPRRLQNSLRRNNRAEHRADFRGLLPHGCTNPPRVLLNPWNTITLRSLIIGTESPSQVCITFATIDGMFAEQTGISSSQRILYRVQRAQCWHIIPNGELNNRVRARFYSLINETTTCDIIKTLAQIDDFGTPARNATAKFIWPRTHQSNVFSDTSTEVVLRLSLESSQQVLLQITVLWKSIGSTTNIQMHPSADGKHTFSSDPMTKLLNEEIFRSVLQRDGHSQCNSFSELSLVDKDEN